jgi:hypothetical protein
VNPTSGGAHANIGEIPWLALSDRETLDAVFDEFYWSKKV